MSSEPEPTARRKLAPAQVLGGFQDLLPAEALAFEDAIEKITAVYRRYGYVPIDTPCIFLYETLAAESGEIDKQLYRWTQGEKDVALRFDLTVPLARYVAANEQSLTFPFKRYHWGKVWRGERQQKGRYREFTQLDFDIVGTKSPTADLEAVLVISDALSALGLDAFQIRINDRLLLNGVLAELGIADRVAEVLRAVDKLDKIGRPGVEEELREKVGLAAAATAAVLDYTALDRSAGNDAILATLAERYGKNELAARGLARLRFILEGARAVLPESRVAIDPAIARGLGYYTGPVFETVLNGQEEYGSVCSGGRYDNLASSYTRRELPGVGASVGLSRLLAALAQRESSGKVQRGAAALIITLPGVSPMAGVRLRAELHAAGLEVELYPQSPEGWDKPVSPKEQFKYASQRGFRVALTLGSSEIEKGTVQLKDLVARKEEEVPRAAIAARLGAALAAGSRA